MSDQGLGSMEVKSKEVLEFQIRYLKSAKYRKLKEEVQMQKWRRHPEIWLEERLREDRRSILWSEYGKEYDDHNWDGTVNPLFEFWKGVANFQDTGLESGTSTGKTYILARMALWFLDVFENPYVITTAPKEKQLLKGVWGEISMISERFKMLRPYSEATTLRMRKDTTHPIYNQTAEIIGEVAGVGAGEESATKFQGKHRPYMLHIIEETPGVHMAIMKAIENTSTGPHNVVCAVGNPDSQVDSLHQFCISPGVKHVIASAYDHPNVVLNHEAIPGAVSVRSIRNRKLKYGEESIFFKSRVRGIAPKQAQDALMNWDWLEMISNPEFEIESDETFPAVGVDVANSEMGDMACTAWGRANTLTGIYEHQCPNANHLAYNLVYSGYDLKKFYDDQGIVGGADFQIPDIGQYQIPKFAIGVDAVGVGAATINTLTDLGIKPASIQGGELEAALALDEDGNPYYRFNSRRSQVFWELREDVREGKIKFAIKDKRKLKQLKEELLAHTYEIKSGKIVVGSKEDVKALLGGKSPNMADSIAYWNHVRKGWYNTKMYIPISSGRDPEDE